MRSSERRLLSSIRSEKIQRDAGRCRESEAGALLWCLISASLGVRLSHSGRSMGKVLWEAFVGES